MEAVESVLSVAGRCFVAEEVTFIQELVRSSPGASRYVLVGAVCERLAWRRSNGKPKLRECRDLLQALEQRGLIVLPPKRWGRPAGRATSVPLTLFGAPQKPIEGRLGELRPVDLVLVEQASDRALWRELVGRYHYLGFTTPYGAYLRYLLYAANGRMLGCLQYSSAAWRLAVRDRWIGWSDRRRAEHLSRVVQQSRFLILPWVRVPHLASHLLALSTRRIITDWEARFGVRPLVVETMVDERRFRGTCYRAANWIEVGTSAGRGRMDREHRRHGAEPKRVFLFPLGASATEQLRGE